ncbi:MULTISPECIES: hypothetical protein [unclassified Streptomyces]|uniref:hypothetical protein n=1 Tax=unclassified Streptomyces TaxID=2593676 RepID=UPI00278C022B|nr:MULTISPECIES: hypothetical protein [unclassified Streptomyces]
MTLELVDDAPMTRSARPNRQWVAPLISSVVTLPAAFFAHLFASLMAMACDSCGDAALARFEPSYERAYTVFGWGLTISLLVLATAWLLPWHERYAVRRIGFSAAAPIAVVVTFVAFMVMIDWP